MLLETTKKAGFIIVATSHKFLLLLDNIRKLSTIILLQYCNNSK